MINTNGKGNELYKPNTWGERVSKDEDYVKKIYQETIEQLNLGGIALNPTQVMIYFDVLKNARQRDLGPSMSDESKAIEFNSKAKILRGDALKGGLLLDGEDWNILESTKAHEAWGALKNESNLTDANDFFDSAYEALETRLKDFNGDFHLPGVENHKSTIESTLAVMNNLNSNNQ